MKRSLLLFSVLFSVFPFAARATPWGLPGTAVIGSSNGQLSICVPEKTLYGVSLDSLFVSERQSDKGASSTMWQIELKENGTPMILKKGDCVFYGAEPSGYLEIVTAKPLRVGGVYYARMDVSVFNPTRQSILFYDVVFCVAKQRDGTLFYPQYKYDQAGRAIKPSC